MFARSPDNHRIAYECIGEGRPTVFLHGFSDSRATWHEVGHLDAFLAAGRRAILIDARGHGDSDKPDDPALYAPRRLAGDVIAVLDDLRVREVDLVGFSMGGGIALATALFCAERVGRFAMIGAHCYGQSLSPFRAALEPGVHGLLELLEAQGVAVAGSMRRRMLANDAAALRAAVAEDRPDRSAMLAVLERPLIAIAGMDDPSFASIKKMANRAGGGFVALEGRNHFTSFLAVEEIGRAVLGFFEPQRTGALAAAGAGE
jgi:pimeloyl-ACP methyl ester carboxylesterase